MIVYYTGHGVYRIKEQYLELTAAEKKAQNKGVKPDAKLNWDKVEEQLRSDDVEGDVLTIMDTCYSSNLPKSGREENKTFELLTACAYDEVTSPPGPYSFTRALIDGLKELLKQYGTNSFTTFNLQEKINSNPIRLHTPSMLWNRFKLHERHIRFAPLKPKDSEMLPQSPSTQPRSYVTLRLALRKSELDQPAIEYLAKKVSSAFSNPKLIGLQRIDWLGMKPARPTDFGRALLAMTYFNKWKRIVFKKREGKSPPPRISIPPPTSVDHPMISSKRKRDGDDEESLPSPKKGLHVQHNPPSPPISTSSKVDEGGEGNMDLS